MESIYRGKYYVLVWGVFLVNFFVVSFSVSARTHPTGTRREPLRLGPIWVEGRLSGDLFLRGRNEGGTVKPLRADALEWRNLVRVQARLRGADDSSLADQGTLTLVVDGETSDESPVLSFSRLVGRQGAPGGYTLKTGGFVLSDLFKASLGGPSLGFRYGFLPPTFNITNGEFLEYDEDVRLYQVAVSAHFPFPGRLIEEIALGGSANSAAFASDITARGTLSLDEVYRLEWSARSSALGPLSLRYSGSFEAWQDPERVARNVKAKRYLLPFASTAASKDFKVLRNNFDLRLKLPGRMMFKFALETAGNLATSEEDFAVSLFGSVMFPSPAGPLKNLIGIDRFMAGAGFYHIDPFAFINLNINRSPIGHEGAVIRLMAVNDLQTKFFRQMVFGVESNIVGNSKFPVSFGDSVRYFLRLNFDTGWL